MIISQSDLNGFINATIASPHDLLGMHRCTMDGKNALVVRAFLRRAETCSIVDASSGRSKLYPLERLAPEGFFEGVIEDREDIFKYRLRIETHAKEVRQLFDPYSFLPTLGEQDVYLFNEGNEHFAYKKLGAHAREIDGVPGVALAVWAPNAKRVSVVGNFNHWDGRYHPMRMLGASGIWELFIPGLEQGELYKFEIAAADGSIRLKTDPYGSYYEPPPNNASIVCDVDSGFEWSDAEWMQDRAKGRALQEAVSVYEMHFGSWRRIVQDNDRPLTYREMAPILADYLIDMGYTHVEVLPLAEFPFDGSWGYQVTGFFAPTHRFGTPDDFKFFVDYLHSRGIGVILDWVPAHFPRDSFALEHFDGTHLYEHADPRQGAHQDWGTLIFNYGRAEVRNFLVSNAVSWCDRYHIDGLRIDAVASMLYLDYSREEGEWVPNRYGGRENLEAIEFLKQVNTVVHERFPGVLTIAEESTAWPGVTKQVQDGGLGFDLKWNMGWMHDSLSYFSKDPLFRKWHQSELTFGMLYNYAENFILVYSHDEVTHGKGSMLMKMGADSITEKAGHLRALYAFMWGWPGKKLIFMGADFGQSAEWAHDRSLDWHLLEYMDHEGVRRLVRDLNRFYRSEKAMYAHDFDSRTFRWINCNDSESSVISFLRHDPERKSMVVVIGNYTPVRRDGYRVGFPALGHWAEVVNSDSEYYGGTNAGNAGGVMVEATPYDGFEFSAALTLPPMSTIMLRWSEGGEPLEDPKAAMQARPGLELKDEPAAPALKGRSAPVVNPKAPRKSAPGKTAAEKAAPAAKRETAPKKKKA